MNSRPRSAILIERLEWLCERMYGKWWPWFMYRIPPKPPGKIKPRLDKYEIEELERELLEWWNGEEGPR